ncbi:alpha/beta fold hydrolase [Agromyces cerinus]|uniref:Pimeloyl-ACP methyl ester carboxylesterase n=1 Tax=Agromyces cerinus subsp. cerinus TaxID=232089 RepID=A0A1N6I5I4_9MICO|nr:alpha/beta hydrolase [Agromyces cerinus]SIO27292.1 Pimeloyl-ACP methyl ester carboxylesterase [Agromyces cerinus subsp. cerinus]
MDTQMPEASGFEHLTVTTPGLATHVAVTGDRDGDPVVMLHGFPQHWWQWRAIAPMLAERYRVYCPDQRGSGWTVAANLRMERETCLNDLIGVLDALGLDRVRLDCHDMGAITGFQFAYRHPERVEALVMLSVPPPFMSFGPEMMSGLRHMPALVWHRPGRSVAGLFDPAHVAQPMPPGTVETYLAPMQRPEIDGAVREIFRHMAVPEATRIARGVYRKQRLQPPTLCVFGRLDRPFPEELVRRLSGDPARYADRFDFAFVDGAAHFITDDAPDAVAELVLEHFVAAEASA